MRHRKEQKRHRKFAMLAEQHLRHTNLQCLRNRAFATQKFCNVCDTSHYRMWDWVLALVIQTIVISYTISYTRGVLRLMTADVRIPKLMTDLRKIVICEFSEIPFWFLLKICTVMQMVWNIDSFYMVLCFSMWERALYVH